MVEYIKLGSPWVGPSSCTVYERKYIAVSEVCAMLNMDHRLSRLLCGPFLLDKDTVASMNPFHRKNQRLFIRVADIPRVLQSAPDAAISAPEVVKKAMRYFGEYVAKADLDRLSGPLSKGGPTPASRPPPSGQEDRGEPSGPYSGLRNKSARPDTIVLSQVAAIPPRSGPEGVPRSSGPLGGGREAGAEHPLPKGPDKSAHGLPRKRSHDYESSSEVHATDDVLAKQLRLLTDRIVQSARAAARAELKEELRLELAAELEAMVTQYTRNSEK
jgi:hypothetical protein